MDSQHQPYPDDVYMSYLLVGDKRALAYEWIKGYLKNLNDQIGEDPEDDYSYGSGSPITMNELIETGMSHVTTTRSWGGDYISRGGAFEGFQTDPTFWDKLADLKEIDIPSDKRGSFFSCSC